MPRVVVVGSTNVDLSFRVSRLPRWGETLAGTALHIGFGGKGANQAIMAARLGADVTMVSAVGDDAFGAQALDCYRQAGVNIDHVHRCNRPTGTAGILVNDHAGNAIVVIPGANAALEPSDVRQAYDAITAADIVLAQMETPAEATAEAFRIAHAAGVPTLLNPAPASQVPESLLCLAEICVPNEMELHTLTDRPVGTLAEVEEAARLLLQRGPTTVVVTLGARGALVVARTESHHCPAVPVHAVDSTAAGDAFIGTLAVTLASGQTLRQAVHRACAVAALSITRPGAHGSFPSPDEIDAFLAQAPASPEPGQE